MVSDNLNKVKVTGKNNKHKVLMYAISTCAWCKMTKKFLNENDVEYEYVDVDLASDEDHEKIREDIISKGGDPSYPTLIVDNKTVITGFRKDKIEEALEL
ncbi:MAG TPA: glutaredoxin family protein [Candidatus Acidoferrales bacterium]|nr:glutaredoxin family protein [Candidatus Acidoferrales bacterium]